MPLNWKELLAQNKKAFGLSGLLGEDAEVYYATLFNTRHVGRVSDLLSARMEDQGVDILGLRFAILMAVFESRRSLSDSTVHFEDIAATDFPSPVILECGIDQEKIGVSVNFTPHQSIEFDPEGLRNRIQSGEPKSSLERVIHELCDRSDFVAVRYHPKTRRVEISAFLDAKPAPDSNGLSKKVRTLEVIVFEKDRVPHPPRPRAYVNLGDMDYGTLLNKRSVEKASTSPVQQVVARKKADSSSSEVSTQESPVKKQESEELQKLFDMGASSSISVHQDPFDVVSQSDETRVSGATSDASETLVKGTEKIDQRQTRVSGTPQEPDEQTRVSDSNRDLEGEIQRVSGPHFGENDQEALIKGGAEEKEDETRIRGGERIDEGSSRVSGGPDRFSDEEQRVRGSAEEGDKHYRIKGATEHHKDEKWVIKGESRDQYDEWEQKVSSKQGKDLSSSEKDQKANLSTSLRDYISQEEESFTPQEGSSDQKEKAKEPEAPKEDGDNISISRKALKGFLSRFKLGRKKEESKPEITKVPEPKVIEKVVTVVKESPRDRAYNEDTMTVKAAKSKEQHEEEKVFSTEQEDLVDQEEFEKKTLASPDPEEPIEQKESDSEQEAETHAERLLNALKDDDGDGAKTIELVKKEAEEIKKATKDRRTGQWVDNLMGTVIQERAKLHEMARKVQQSIRLKEMEHKDKLGAIRDRLRKKEAELIKEKSSASRARDQVSHLSDQLDAERRRARGRTDEYRDRYENAKKQLDELVEENNKLRRRVGSHIESSGGPTEAQYSGLQKRYDNVNRQVEELRKANRNLMTRLNETKRHPSAGDSDDTRRKLEASMKVIATEKREKEALKMRFRTVLMEQNRAKDENKKLEFENRKLNQALIQIKASLANKNKGPSSGSGTSGSAA